MALPPPRQELTPDYSMESHQRDHENYVACSRGHPRRAKALLDFERHDDDELGFRKNDIITVRGERRLPLAAGGVATPSPGCWSRASGTFLWQIVSQKDEHCWVGELNGLRGEASVWSVSPGQGRAGQAVKLRRRGVCLLCLWPCVLSPVAGGASGRRAACLTGSASPTGWFPAKFVEVLDERSKEVSAHARWAGLWGPRPFCPEAGALLALGCVPRPVECS